MKATLASMPFGMIFSPSIALGMLKRIAESCGCDTHVHYFGFQFANAMGISNYNDVAARLPTHALIGEWVFSSCFGDISTTEESEFVEKHVRPLFEPGTSPVKIGATDEDKFIASLLKARAEAPSFVEECADQILGRSPDVVGLTTTFQQNCASLSLAKRLKELSPDTKIVLGGANCENPMGAALAEVAPWLDFVVSGEGEAAFEKIIIGLAQSKADTPPEQLPSAGKPEVIANGFSSDMDSLPIPDYSDFFNQLPLLGNEGAEIGIQVPIETARGCWWGAKHHCTFCGLNGHSMAFRSKTASRAFSEIRAITDLYPGSKIAFTDNILDMKYFRTLLPMLADTKIEMNGFWEVKANLSRDHLLLLRDSGVRRVQPGIESFSGNVLKRMQKGVRPIQNLQFLVDCVSAGIWPSWNILWGFPGETSDDYDATIKLLPSLFHLPPPVGAGPVGIHRFSPMFERGDELGAGKKWPAPAYDYVFQFAAEKTADIAYFFDGEYALSDQVKSMTDPIKHLVAAWKDDYQRSVLVSVKRGQDMVVLDSRDAKQRSVTRLTREQQVILDRAGKAVTFEQLEVYGGGFDPQKEIDTLVKCGFLASLEGWYLSLVLDIQDITLDQKSKIEALMNSLRSDRQSEDRGQEIRLEPELAL